MMLISNSYTIIHRLYNQENTNQVNVKLVMLSQYQITEYQ